MKTKDWLKKSFGNVFKIRCRSKFVPEKKEFYNGNSINKFDPEKLKTLVKNGEIDINGRCGKTFEGTPLHAASLCNNSSIDLIKCLIDLGADVNSTTTKYKDTPLHNASKMGNVDNIKTLIQHGANVNARDWIDWTPLHCAVWANKLQAVNFLLDQESIQIDSRNSNGETPLRLAVKGNNHKLISLLLNSGADLESKDSELGTALHWAASRGKINLVHHLVVKLKSDLEAVDRYNRTPLKIALDYGKTEVALSFVQLGANLNSVDKNELIILASKNGHSGAVRRLTAEGACPNQRDPGFQRTPLHWAIKEGEPEVILTLLENGARPDYLDKYQKTPLEWAILYGDTAAVTIITKWQTKSISHPTS